MEWFNPWLKQAESPTINKIFYPPITQRIQLIISGWVTVINTWETEGSLRKLKAVLWDSSNPPVTSFGAERLPGPQIQDESQSLIERTFPHTRVMAFIILDILATPFKFMCAVDFKFSAPVLTRNWKLFSQRHHSHAGFHYLFYKMSVVLTFSNSLSTIILFFQVVSVFFLIVSQSFSNSFFHDILFFFCHVITYVPTLHLQRKFTKL